MKEIPITARDSDYVSDVVKTMYQNNVGSIVVVDEVGRPIGIFTERDLVRLVSQGLDPRRTVIGDVMSKEVIVVERDASLLKAVHIMAKHGIRHLPVVDERGVIVGVISIRDAAVTLARVLVNLDLSRFGFTQEELVELREIAELEG